MNRRQSTYQTGGQRQVTGAQFDQLCCYSDVRRHQYKYRSIVLRAFDDVDEVPTRTEASSISREKQAVYNPNLSIAYTGSSIK